MTVDPIEEPAVATTRSGVGLRGRDLRGVIAFTVLALGLGWLVALPLWLGEGLASPSFLVVSIATMATPACAALLVVFFVERPRWKARSLGLWPVRPVPRVLGHVLLGIAVSLALVLAALPVGALLGVYPADFANLSGFRQALDERAGTGELPLSPGTLIAVQLAALPLGALINLVPALGEELGWRGWLLPKLMPLGTLPALLIMGVIWGTWHAPLVLLGYNYPDAPGWLGVTAMVGMCTLIGAVFGWLRLRSGSVWPAAFAHAAFNAAGGTYLLFARAGAHVDTTQATILGWSGWIVPLVLVAVLLAAGQFAPARHPATPGRDEVAAPVPGGGTGAR
ncbi:CPBP family intramembrane glutamic endopeptidase [Saccharopolyspora sp. MS10]|uniref:CPBP family intramembrane glutamic endopeptidase n=1 Tax=Saccharopolyspora sp. MS10 TaxID=3385973 RepID=UPI0039A3DE5B